VSALIWLRHVQARISDINKSTFLSLQSLTISSSLSSTST
jgi:hypothetical protein